MIEKTSEKSMLAPRDVIRMGASLAFKTILHWRVVAIAFLIGLLAAIVAPKIMPPVFTSETLIIYDEVIQTENLLGAQQYATESRRQMGMRLREMLLSRDNLEEIVKTQNLYSSIVEGRGMVDAVEEFRSKIDCHVRENETFRIGFQGEDPAVVYSVTSALSDSLIEQNRKYRRNQAEATRQFLANEQKNAAEALTAKDAEISAFLNLNPSFAIDMATTAATMGASVRAAARSGSTTDTGIAALDRRIAALNAQLNSPSPTVAPGATMDPESAAAIESAQAAYQTAGANLKQAESKFQPGHPSLAAAQKDAKQALDRLNQAKASARTTAKAPSGAQLSPAEARESIRTEIARLQADKRRLQGGTAATERVEASHSTEDPETQWARLRREKSELDDQHDLIQSRLGKAIIVAKVEADEQGIQMRVVDKAYEPQRPTRRGARRTSAMVLGVVTALGLAVAFGLGLLDDRLYNEQDVRKLEIGPILHVVPRQRKQKKGYV